MKRKKAMELVGWLDRVSDTVLACETRISPRGGARELPPEAPTQDEAHAFRDGLVIGMQIASTIVEDMADGAPAPDLGPMESYAKAIDIWMKKRCRLTEAGEEG